MSAIAIGSVLMTISGIIVGTYNFDSIPLMIGLVVMLIGIVFQMYGINKIEITLSDMREEYINLFNHSDEYTFSFDHPEKFQDVEEKSVEKIDTLNGTEN